MTKIKMVQAVGELIVSIGVGAIVSNAINATTPANVKTLNKVCISVGSIVLMSMASDQATKYIEEKFNSAATKIMKDMATEKVD